MSGVGTAIAIGTVAAAGIGATSSILAGKKQADAAKSGAQLQADEQQKALDFQKEQWDTQQKNQAPFLSAGTKAVNSLSELTSTPGKGLLTPYGTNFTPPSASDVSSEPGYQFTEKQGLDAINKEASATGNVFSGNTLTEASKFGTGLASTTYNDAYQRALQTWQSNYNLWNNNNTNEYNRLAGIAGTGQIAANQLGTTGQAASSNVGNIDVSTGRNISQSMNDAAAAEASGYVGASNAIGGGVNSFAGYSMLNNLLNKNSSTNSFSPYADPGLSVMQPSYMPGGVNPADLVPPDVAGVYP